MRKFFAVAMGSAVALLGFAGAANASATVDLVWIDVTTTNTAGKTICLLAKQRNCPVIGSEIGVSPSTVLVSDSITLGVIVTAGPNGLSGGGLSVDYSAAAGHSVTAFQAMVTTYPLVSLPLQLGSTTDTGTFIDNINAAASVLLGNGIGLPSGGTAYLGTVTFHKDALVNGTFEIAVGTNGPGGTDGLLDNDPTDPQSIVPVFNNAWLINVPEPGALSLLVMGVGGMLLAGRGRRS
jgi:hypothetical protein